MKHWVDSDGTDYPLLRCPFCGVEAAIIITQNELWEEQMNPERYTVCCARSNGGCGATSGFHETAQAAATRWNTRVVI